MACRIDINKDALKHALELKIGSLKRAIKTTPNPLMRELIEKDIAMYVTAQNTITEVK